MWRLNAYEPVGSCRGSAELCGTTHKTVKRVLGRRDVGQPTRRVSVTNTAGVRALIAERVRASDGRMGQSGCCRSPRRRATAGRRVIFGGRSPAPKRSGSASGAHIDHGCPHRVSTWRLIGRPE